MRIGILLMGWGIGGSEKRFANLFKYVSANSRHSYTLIANAYLTRGLSKIGIALDGHRVHRLMANGWASCFDMPAPRLGRLGGVRVRGASWLAWHLYESARHLSLGLATRRLSRDGFDVIHYVHPYYVEPAGMAVGRVLSCQDTGLRRTLLRNRFFLDALCTDGFFDIASNPIKQVLVDRLGVCDGRRLRVAPCTFVDYGRTSVGPKEPLVAFVGRMDPAKNPLLFVDALQIVRASHPSLRAVLLGDGLLKSEVEARIRAYRLQDAVTVGFHPKPEDLLARALVYVSIQSLDNYHSQALLEAMACGCAVVASDVGETDRVVSESTGLRVPLNATAIADEVGWLLDHPREAEAMGMAGRRAVTAEHTVERYSAFLESLYADAAGAAAGCGQRRPA